MLGSAEPRGGESGGGGDSTSSCSKEPVISDARPSAKHGAARQGKAGEHTAEHVMAGHRQRTHFPLYTNKQFHAHSLASWKPETPLQGEWRRRKKKQKHKVAGSGGGSPRGAIWDVNSTDRDYPA
ncbi:hypothetical protein E2C01_022747 [Portunus trituberculatus]|uniref:Uncharacterized protein n=1 Tax=Portunus trituberculatus TaxID=210409 RepID=A0A5B7E7X5_PORTR|nr:hypothetical protein [Portunus trituberculatus]